MADINWENPQIIADGGDTGAIRLIERIGMADRLIMHTTVFAGLFSELHGGSVDRIRIHAILSSGVLPERLPDESPDLIHRAEYDLPATQPPRTPEQLAVIAQASGELAFTAMQDVDELLRKLRLV